ncbi:hypothetical protein D3C78_1646050 [compost metagenome]
MQVVGGGGLAAALEQFGEFGAQGGDFAMVLLQATVAAMVQHGQRIDRAVERQFAPQPRKDIGAPFVGDLCRVQIVQPDRCDRMASVAQPSEAVAGKHYAPVAIAKCTLGA